MTNPTELHQRVKEAQSGDVQALALLFQVYRARLLAHALRVVGNPVAQDVVQDTFLHAHAHIHSLRNASLVYPWLKSILLNNCYQTLRKERSGTVHHGSIATDALIEESIEAHIERSAATHSLYAVVGGLSSELRSCVLLRYFSSYERYEDIAAVLGIPLGTVRSRLAAARATMYARYAQHNDATDAAFVEARKWSDYYRQLWHIVYDDVQARGEFVRSLKTDLLIRRSSGATARGRDLLEREINDDLRYGSRWQVSEVHSSGNISVLEGTNTNSPQHPERCAPSTVVVLFRDDRHRVTACNIFDSPRRADAKG